MHLVPFDIPSQNLKNSVFLWYLWLPNSNISSWTSPFHAIFLSSSLTYHIISDFFLLLDFLFYAQDLARLTALSHSTCSTFQNFPSWSEIVISGVSFICWPEISYQFLDKKKKGKKWKKGLERGSTTKIFPQRRLFICTSERKIRELMLSPVLFPTHTFNSWKKNPLNPPPFPSNPSFSVFISCDAFITWTCLCYCSSKTPAYYITSVYLPKLSLILRVDCELFRTGASVSFSDSTGVS